MPNGLFIIGLSVTGQIREEGGGPIPSPLLKFCEGLVKWYHVFIARFYR